jgi:hypothetical protein
MRSRKEEEEDDEGVEEEGLRREMQSGRMMVECTLVLQ